MGLKYRCPLKAGAAEKGHLYFYRREAFDVTAEQASERYHIPMQVLREYESWGLCGACGNAPGARQYDGRDLERLSMILGLRDMGFTGDETEAYMRLLLESPHSEEERLGMLAKKRAALLDEIHVRERQLDRLDCLRHKIRKSRPGAGQRAGQKAGRTISGGQQPACAAEESRRPKETD